MVGILVHATLTNSQNSTFCNMLYNSDYKLILVKLYVVTGFKTVSLTELTSLCIMYRQRVDQRLRQEPAGFWRH